MFRHKVSEIDAAGPFIDNGAWRSAGNITGTTDDDRLVGTDRRDSFLAFQGGSDNLSGRGGDDSFFLGTTFDATDRIDGGEGRGDILYLSGDYSPGLTIDRFMLTGVERIVYNNSGFLRRDSFTITLAGDLHDGSTIQSLFAGIDNSVVVGRIVFDGSAVVRTKLDIEGSIDDDVLRGGALADRLYGDSGADILYGGGGRDVFVYSPFDFEQPRHGDTIMDFADGDRIDLSLFDLDFRLNAPNGAQGTIDLRYSRADNETHLRISTDSDAKPELVITLAGNHLDLTIADFII